MPVLVAGCSTKVPINGSYDMTLNIEDLRENPATNLEQAESDLFACYKGSPEVVDFIAKIQYPDFTYRVHYLAEDKEDLVEVWEIKKIDQNRYRLNFNARTSEISTIELVYDPDQESLKSRVIKYNKR